MWSKKFWKEALDRAIKSFAQGAVALLSADGIGLFGVQWQDVFSVAGMMFVLSILTSIGSAPIGESGTASILK